MSATLHIVTTAAPTPVPGQAQCKSYTCDHLECARERSKRHAHGAATCRCTAPLVDTADSRGHCIRCGRDFNLIAA